MGFVVGSGVAAILMAVQLWWRMRKTIGATIGDLVGVIEHETLEI
jgi:hypothetical protein